MGAMAYGNYGEIDHQNKWNEGKIRLNILVRAAEENAVLQFAKPPGKYQFTATEEFIKDCKEAVRNPEKFDVNFLGEGGASFKNKWKGKKPIAYVKDGQKHHVLWNALEKTGSEAGDYNMVAQVVQVLVQKIQLSLKVLFVGMVLLLLLTVVN